ncbi:hypothetical protein RQP46_007168 [Phenoliferia psychrophenolica]
MRLGSTLSLLSLVAATLGFVTTPLSNGHNNYTYSTGITKKFFLNITAGIVAPDGFERQGILVNGTTPGPTIAVDEGDEVEITVLNLSGRATSVHWHGIEQRGTAWSDGTTGVTQYPTKSGATFVYQWKASFLCSVVTSWADTLVEPLCQQSMPINGKGQVICPSQELLAQYNCQPDNVSSAAWYDCKNTSTSLEVINVDVADGWASLHIVNSGANWETVVSIDEHTMWVYAADGSYIEPVEVHSISVPMGERYSVFVKLDKLVGESFNIRTAANVMPQVVSGYAILHYTYLGEGAKTFTAKVDSKPFIGAAVYVLNNQPFSLWREEEVPPLFDPQASINANLSFAYESNSVVDLILLAPLGQPPHPIHKHVAASKAGSLDKEQESEHIKLLFRLSAWLITNVQVPLVVDR